MPNINDIIKETVTTIDFPPELNVYKQQAVEKGVDAAIKFVFRCMYNSQTLLPMIPGLFINVPERVFDLGTEEYRMQLQSHLENIISSILKDHMASVNLNYDYENQRLIYDISFHGVREVTIENGASLSTAVVTKNRKKFYD